MAATAAGPLTWGTCAMTAASGTPVPASVMTCPTLVQVAAQDAVTPRRVALRAAHAMARPTVHTYDCGHFDPYVEPFFSAVVADQLAFLTANVPVAHSR